MKTTEIKCHFHQIILKVLICVTTDADVSQLWNLLYVPSVLFYIHIHIFCKEVIISGLHLHTAHT